MSDKSESLANDFPICGEVLTGFCESCSHTRLWCVPFLFISVYGKKLHSVNNEMSGVGDENEVQHRIAEVHAWQRYYNMEPRNDSRLTKLYANGEISMSAAEVARELLATDFIYSNTLYGEVIEEFMRAVAKRIRAEYRLSWSSTWKIVSFYGPIALKLMCLGSAGVRVPECMPFKEL